VGDRWLIFCVEEIVMFWVDGAIVIFGFEGAIAV
jgi:hypothetical protein